MTTLSFREWSTTTNVALTTAQRDALRITFGATVQPSLGSHEHYDITPGNTIGALQVGDLTLLVEPKIPISRVLFLLGYAADPTGFGPDDAELGVLPDLVSGVARLLAGLTDRALRRGLLKGYRTVDAAQLTVRGRIDLAEQLRRRPGVELPLAVTYQEYDEDVLENRLLLAALTQLRRLPLRDLQARRSLRRLADTLQNVGLEHYSPSAVPAVTWTRLNQHLRPAVELARLLLQLHAPDIRAGATRTPSLTIDMAVLFETFVRVAVREGLATTDSQFPSGDTCRPLHLDTRRLVRLKPDLSYWPGQRCRFIGDVKYKRDSGSGHNSDLYQLLAYATATRLPEATLVYALGPSTPRTHRIPGADVSLHIEHLDLSQHPPALLEQVRSLSHRLQQVAALRDDIT